MPGPLRLGAQRHAFIVKLRKCLETCDVSGKGKFAIAHAERRERIRFRKGDIVPGNQRVTVDLMI